ncbi:MAG: nicotinate-nucleotide adenylyltransferase, partial [Pseudomonadota bacterium]
MKRLGLTEVWFVVARGNPLKSDHGEYEARATSVRHLINGNSGLKLCEVEAEHGLTYTIDTVRTLQHLYRSDQFVWIMGSDSL